MFAKLGYYICVPFAFLTRLFYSWTGSYGVALILFTLVVKLVLLPFQLKSKKSMLRMNRMQGKIKDIQTRYANNQQRQQEAMQELYMKEGINPMSGCLWSMIPFPILIALYYIIRVPLRYFMSLSESVIAEITTLAGTLGFTAAEGSQAYEQIYLAKFIHEHWADFAGKFDGLIDLNYNFLHIDLAAQPSSLFSQFPGGGWPVWGALLLLGAGLIAVLVYIIRSHLTVDRIIGINLIGTLVVIAISILTYLLGEDYLADIAVVYVVLSFIAVAMLCRIYINLYDRRKEETQDDR